MTQEAKMQGKRLAAPIHVAALLLFTSPSTLAHDIHVPAGAPEEQGALEEAAERLAAELDGEFLPSGAWGTTPIVYSGTSSPGGTDIVVLLETSDYFDPVNFDYTVIPSGEPVTEIKEDAYYIEAVDPGSSPIYVHATSYEGAIAAVHGMRLFVRQNDYTLDPGMHEMVNPAFRRRGFMVLAPGGFRLSEWKALIDYHQLVGANTITVSAPLDALDVIEGALEHSRAVGMEFQVLTSANGVSPDFFWKYYEAPHQYYDPQPQANASAFLGGGEPEYSVGAQSDDGIDAPHDLTYYGVAASLELIATPPPSLPPSLAGELGTDFDADQDPVYQQLSEADAFVVVTTEGAVDFGPAVINDPTEELCGTTFDRISDRIPASSDAEIVYWGWLHDVLYRARLDDPAYAVHTAFQDFAEVTGSYSRIATEMSSHNSGPNEWVQEVGTFYPFLGLHTEVVAGLGGDYLQEDFGLADPNAPELYALADPLGFLDREADAGLLDAFQRTGYLYWSHVETKLRNYLPRPAIRAMVMELRAMLRHRTILYPGLPAYPVWSHGADPATGVMGYRFAAPRRRPCNDYVVLRCASDDRLLGIDPTDPVLDVAELDAVQDAVAEDMARFLARGRDPEYLSVQASIDRLDDFGRLFPSVSPSPGDAFDVDLLEDALKMFDQSSIGGDQVDWWVTTELANYYHLLAFTYYVEKGATWPDGGNREQGFIDAAVEVARQTSVLEEYSLGRDGVNRGEIDQLVDARR